MKAGYVYILINQSFADLIKIGKTVRDSRSRARELSTTGVPTPYQVAFEIFSDDCDELEAKAHAELTEFRVAANREFFRYPLSRAIALLQSHNGAPCTAESTFVAEDILTRLAAKYPGYLRPDIVAVRIVQPGSCVWLEVTTEQVLAGYLRNQTVERTDLGFIADDEPFFRPGASVSENSSRFVDELDAYSIVMTTDLFSAEACAAIGDRHNRSTAPEGS